MSITVQDTPDGGQDVLVDGEVTLHRQMDGRIFTRPEGRQVAQGDIGAAIRLIEKGAAKPELVRMTEMADERGHGTKASPL